MFKCVLQSRAAYSIFQHHFCHHFLRLTIKRGWQWNKYGIFTLPSCLAKKRWLVGQSIFCPIYFNFWLFNSQIWTLFWPINFLRLQLQNNLALGQGSASLRSGVGNFSYNRVILLFSLAHMIGEEPQDVDAVLFYMRLRAQQKSYLIQIQTQSTHCWKDKQTSAQVNNRAEQIKTRSSLVLSVVASVCPYVDVTSVTNMIKFIAL